MKKQIIYMCINLENIFPKYNIIGHLRLREISLISTQRMVENLSGFYIGVHFSRFSTCSYLSQKVSER